MKQTKKISCLLLLSLLASVGCQSAADSDTQTTDGQTETSAVETETAELTIESVLPDSLDFGGETIRFAVELGNQNFNTMSTSIYVEEDTGDIIDSAIYNRNIKIEEYLNLEIEIAQEYGPTTLYSNVTNSVLAGSDDFDVVAAYNAYTASLAASGALKCLDDFRYLDTDAPYWPTELINMMAYKGTYWVMGDLNLTYTGGLGAMYVNASIWDELYHGTSIYDVVRDGKWTLDYMTKTIEDAYIDLNGNTQVDADDRFGFIYTYIETFATGCGLKYSERDKNGVPQLTFMSEHSVDVWNKLYTCIFNGTGCYGMKDDEDKFAFKNGKSLYLMNSSIAFVINDLRDMTDDFFIIPLPKYDEEQDVYYSKIADNMTIYGVPVTSQKDDAVGALLEAMEIESVRTVVPAYYDMALKNKYTRDADSAEMLDLIRSNIVNDFVCLYSETIGGGVGVTGKGIARILRTAATQKTTDLASLYEKNAAVYQSCLDDLLERFDVLAEERK